MFRYKLRTLLILLAVGPPLLALAWLALPVIYALIAVVLVASLIAFSARWADLSHAAILRESDQLKREISELGSDENRNR